MKLKLKLKPLLKRIAAVLDAFAIAIAIAFAAALATSALIPPIHFSRAFTFAGSLYVVIAVTTSRYASTRRRNHQNHRPHQPLSAA